MKIPYSIPCFFLFAANLAVVNGQTADRNLINDSLPSFLAFSDMHLHANTNLQEAKGDSDDSLWALAKNEIINVIHEKKPRFLLMLGDIPFHADCMDTNSVKEAQKSLDIVVHQLNDIARETGIPIIMVPGNNDSWDGNYRKFNLPDSFFNVVKYPVMDYPDKDFSDTASLIDASHIKDGYYSVYPNGKKYGLRIICLSTTMFAKDNRCSYGANKDSDAYTQLTWLTTELKNAGNSNERVLIAMHIPPGINGYGSQNSNVYMWYSADIQNRLLNLVHDYQDNIIGLLASHTHMDGVRLLRNNKADSITSLLISVPGIAPGHGNNPAIKLIEYDPNRFALKNFVTYYMDCWNADTTKTLRDWDSSFSFSNIAPGYDPSSMNMLNYFQNSCNKNCLDQLIDSIYTVKSKDPKAQAETKSGYVDYENN